MNQAELQELVEVRLKDAEMLIEGGRWEFAYYAAGYAVECALKSCVLSRMIYTAWVFEERWNADNCRTHEFRKLISLAGLNDQLNADLKASAAAGGEFAANWGIAVKWASKSRYEIEDGTRGKRVLHRNCG